MEVKTFTFSRRVLLPRHVSLLHVFSQGFLGNLESLRGNRWSVFHNITLSRIWTFLPSEGAAEETASWRDQILLWKGQEGQTFSVNLLTDESVGETSITWKVQRLFMSWKWVSSLCFAPFFQTCGGQNNRSSTSSSQTFHSRMSWSERCWKRSRKFMFSRITSWQTSVSRLYRRQSGPSGVTLTSWRTRCSSSKFIHLLIINHPFSAF